MAQDIPENIREFFENYIDSVELLHVLMLLRDHQKEVWTTRTISAELRSSESSVGSRIRTLIGRKVLAADASVEGKIVYRPFGTEVSALIDQALESYKQRPYRVVELIFSRRTDAIRSIADAFRIRKED